MFLAGCGADSTAIRCIITAQCPPGESCSTDHQCVQCGTATCDPGQVCWHFNCLDPGQIPDGG
jgi:hypothetical protein